MPNARIMIHQPLGGASGQAVDIEIQAKEIMFHKANLNRILAACTGKSVRQGRGGGRAVVAVVRWGLVAGWVAGEGWGVGRAGWSRPVHLAHPPASPIPPCPPASQAAQIDADTDRDRYMSALEAKQYGLIDRVIGGDDAGFKARGRGGWWSGGGLGGGCRPLPGGGQLRRPPSPSP